MKITRDEVERVAQLARLTLSNEEVDKMTRQLDTILTYVAKLDELDSEGGEPTARSQQQGNAFREDVAEASLPHEKALQAAPLHNDESFVVPKVVG